MEFVDFGSLTEILDQYPRGLQLSEAEIGFICLQTLKGLENIHGLGVIHRDIKTDNILLGTDGRVLLADFGSAARLSTDRPNRKTVIGSPYWMAPELIRGEEYSQKVDIFSFGCMLRELATGDPPFADLPPLKCLFLLATSDVPPLKSVEGRKWSPAFLDFCNKCVRKDPAVRPGASDLLQHPFLGLACTQEEFKGVIAQATAMREKEKAQPLTPSLLPTSVLPSVLPASGSAVFPSVLPTSGSSVFPSVLPTSILPASVSPSVLPISVLPSVLPPSVLPASLAPPLDLAAPPPEPAFPMFG